MINPIYILAPMLRDLAAQTGLTVDETAVTEARNYCEEMVPMSGTHAEGWRALHLQNRPDEIPPLRNLFYSVSEEWPWPIYDAALKAYLADEPIRFGDDPTAWKVYAVVKADGVTTVHATEAVS